jgi:hypothetical protein
LTEIAQFIVGRSPSWHDALANTVGALVGFIWSQNSPASSPSERLCRVAICVALIVGVSVNPLLVFADAALQRLEAPRAGAHQKSG